VNVEVRKRSTKIDVTLLICRALARSCASCGPILADPRFSMVSVCMNSRQVWSSVDRASLDGQPL